MYKETPIQLKAKNPFPFGGTFRVVLVEYASEESKMQKVIMEEMHCMMNAF